MRYAWSQGNVYSRAMGLTGLALGLARPYLRAWDRRSAGHVDCFVANSCNVADRIRRTYGRAAQVIYPPIDTDFFSPGGTAREAFYVMVGAFAPYKRVDLAMAACAKLGRRLVIVGSGQQQLKLARKTPKKVEFLGQVSAEAVRDLYRRAAAVLFPGEEDFGMVPVEAMACGCPVIAYGVGGATETVLDAAHEFGPTGALFAPQSADALADAIVCFEQQRDVFNADSLRAWALQFGVERFLREIRELLGQLLPGVQTAS